MKLEKLNFHERDSRITFDEDPHVYYIDNKPYSLSVTSFIKTFFQEFDPNYVIEKNYNKWQANTLSKYYGLSINQIKAVWKKTSDDALAFGSRLHKDIELFYNDIDVVNNSPEYYYFLNLHNRIEEKCTPYRTEWMIFDEDIEIAGSVDMCYTDKKDNLLIFDWKRSKEIKKNNDFRKGKYPLNHLDDSNYWHYSLQLNIYKYILENKYKKIVSGLYLVCLHPNQENYKLITIPNLQSEVIKMIEKRKRNLI